MNNDKNTKISVTLEVSSYELQWLSKLFCMMDDAKALAYQNGSLADEKIKEIKEVVHEYHLHKDSKPQEVVKLKR